MTVQGHVEPGFEKVRDVFERQFADGQHIGASVAVYLGEKLAVNLWGGTTEPEGGAPWREDTMAIMYSTTKGLTATCLHVLADRGVIDYDDLVTKHWPEFGQNGKDKITVAHLLTHQSGVAEVPSDLTLDDLTDWDKVIHAIERLAPAWQPGAASGYHALTFGYLIGELVRRVSGKSVGTFMREEITEPLGITKLYIGAPESEEPDIAPLFDRSELTAEQEAMRKQFFGGESLTGKAMGAHLSSEERNLQDLLNSRAGHAAEIPAVGGLGSARDLARFYAVLANGGTLDGTRVISEERISIMGERRTHRPDKVIILPVGWALGYMTGGDPGWPQGLRTNSFGHPGLGGSVGFADPEIKMAFGFVPNALKSDLIGAGRASELAEAARASL